MGICRWGWFDFWSRSSTGHSAGTRPASKPGSRNSKQDQQERPALSGFYWYTGFRGYVKQFWGAILELIIHPTGMGVCRWEWFDFWGRRSTRHSEGARPASKPGSRTSKQHPQARPASKTSIFWHLYADLRKNVVKARNTVNGCVLATFGRWNAGIYAIFGLYQYQTPVKRCFALMNAKHWYLRVFQKSKIVTRVKPCK